MFTLTVSPNVLVLDVPTNSTLGDPVELTATSPNPSVIYFWDFDNDGDFDDASGPIVIFPTAGLTLGQHPVSVQGCVHDPNGDDDLCTIASIVINVVAPDEPEPSYDNLRRLTLEYVDNPFVAHGLALLVDLAAAADSRGLDRVADSIIDAYIRGVQVITPRFLTIEEAGELMAIAVGIRHQ